MRSILIFLPIVAFLTRPAFAQTEAVRGFVTLEPFETRVEALCRPAAFSESWELYDSVIRGPKKEMVLNHALQALRQRVRLRSPRHRFEFDSAHIRFVKEVKDLGYVPDDRDEIPLQEAIVGVSLSALARDVDELEVEWTWLGPEQFQAPVRLTFGNESLARFLTREQPFLRWRRPGGSRAEETPKLLPVPAVQLVKRSHQPVFLYAGLGILGLAGLVVLVRKTRTPAVVFFAVPLGIVALAGAFRFARTIPVLPESDGASDLVYSLLRNTYHAFDFRDESEIYEILEESISGPLLESVYLQVRKGLELEIQGGPRVRIKGIDLRECQVIAKNDDSGEFDVQSEWVAVGDVNHWGHSHLRTNRYQASLRIKAVNSAWKITKMRIINEQRTQQVTKTE